MSLTPEQIAELQARAAKADELEQRLNAVDAKKAEILDEKKQMQAQLSDALAQLADLQVKNESGKGTKEERDKLAQEVEELRQQTKELHGLLSTETTKREEAEKQRIADRVRNDFTSAFAGKVHVPAHLWTALRESVQDDGGRTVATYNGKKVAVSELPAMLAVDPEYSYHFLPERPRGGMGLRPSPAGVVDVSSNPWITGNITQQVAIRTENPELADKLKVEASAARREG